VLCVHGIGDGKPRFLPVGIAGGWNWRGKRDQVINLDDQGCDLNEKSRDVTGPIPDLAGCGKMDSAT
jgi:hypothetical protein